MYIERSKTLFTLTACDCDCVTILELICATSQRSSDSGFPLGLEKLENLEKWEGIFQSGKSEGKSHKILENSGNFRKILFAILVIFK